MCANTSSLPPWVIASPQPISSLASEARIHESSVRGPACLSVRAEAELLKLLFLDYYGRASPATHCFLKEGRGGRGREGEGGG